MAKKNGSNLMESVLETQKNIVDKMVESTKKLTNGNTIVNETINKGSEWYNNWLESQKNAFNTSTNQAENMSASMQNNAQKMNEFFQNWMSQQSNAAKQMWDMNQNWYRSAADQNKGFDMMNNPMAQFNNWSNQMNNMMNAWNGQNNMMNQFQNWSKNMMSQNPFTMDSMKANADSMTNLFNHYNEMMNYNFSNMQNAFKSNTPQDAFRNMMNINEGFMRFAQMWSPMMSSIQNKTFNMDTFKQMANPEMFKSMMDQLFGLMPEHTSQYFQQLAKMIQENVKQMNSTGNYQQMKNMMNGMMPNMAQNDMMEHMLAGYTNMKNSLHSIFSPMGKLTGNNEYTKTAAEWSDLADKMVVYNIKNAELQHMIYERGTKVMEKVAESIVHKLENGEEVNSMMALYQEWLNLSDTTYVDLFESDDYTALMAEVASLKMKLSKDTDMLVEKSLAKFPIATRSEVEELHKTIYELKKQVRQLERMMEMETPSDEEEMSSPKATAKKSGTKK